MAIRNLKQVFEDYVAELRRIPLEEKTEHTDRSALENLLRALAPKGVLVQQEPKRISELGAPDFKIARKGMILGYVENKPVGDNLDKVLKSAQIKRYRELSDNILLTDYLHWIWISGNSIHRENLCFPTDLEGRRTDLKPERVDAVAGLVEGFFSEAPQGVGRAEQLALALATRSHLLRDFLTEELIRQEREHQEGRLYGLYKVFREHVFAELMLKEFADAFAQTLAYGLFLAKLNTADGHSGNGKIVTLHNAQQYVPGSFRLIRELVDFVDLLENDPYQDIRWVVEEILSIVNGMDVAAIQEDLSFRGRRSVSRTVRARDEEEHRLFERDPFIYFYEGYLAKYDAKMRKSRGVYYTPPPVVNFIIRAVDDILRAEFGIKGGLADHSRVTVLDFACGTGTFLLEVFERIFDTMGADSGARDLIVRDHILKNIYGFEYLIAPYTIAHLKLSQYLKDKGRELKGSERLRIYLTNTLEPVEPQIELLLPALTEEMRAAQDVKEMPILVITGNPPYSGHSKNKGQWATQSINAYKFVDGEPLGEKNPKWLHDDYVKFIRFAQMKMDAVPEGVVGIITNHSWLDNPTFRGMRRSLMTTFDRIYVIDLHGNTKKKERAPDGGDDQNVFDIEQGVAIALFVKKPGVKKGVWHADAWGKRLPKYQLLANSNRQEIGWAEVDSFPPYYLFNPLQSSDWGHYKDFWGVSQIFKLNGIGIMSKRDKIAFQFYESEIKNVVRDFAAMSATEIERKYGSLLPSRDWKIGSAKENIKKFGLKNEYFKKVAYRPFDERCTYHTNFSRGFLAYPVFDVMRHMLRDNIGISTIRKMDISGDWEHILAFDKPTTHHTVSLKEGNYLFPLYLYPPPTEEKKPAAGFFEDEDPFQGHDRVENFAPEFRAWIDGKYGNHYTPEEILGVIYAVLHAPAYRGKYQEFLRIDFPRIPFPDKRKDFEKLSALGWDLIQKHLLRDVPNLGLGKYRGRGTDEVERPQYVEAERAVYINATKHFAPVSPEVWNFHIGGYQVIEKYLKSRRGRTLSLDEVRNIENVANVLAFTLAHMQKIDEAYTNAFR